jgi:GTPase
MKAGMMEIADLFLLNKSDLPGSDRAAADLQSATGERPVIRCSATAGTGLEEAVAAIRSAHLRATAECAVTAWMVRLQEMYRERAARALAKFDIGQAARDLAARKRDPWSVTKNG